MIHILGAMCEVECPLRGAAPADQLGCEGAGRAPQQQDAGVPRPGHVVPALLLQGDQAPGPVPRVGPQHEAAGAGPGPVHIVPAVLSCSTAHMAIILVISRVPPPSAQHAGRLAVLLPHVREVGQPARGVGGGDVELGRLGTSVYPARDDDRWNVDQYF